MPFTNSFHLDEPWDSPHNLELAKRGMPSVFQSPENPLEGKTRVMVFTGKGAAFDGGKKVSFADFVMVRPTPFLRGGGAGQGRDVDQSGGPALRCAEKPLAALEEVSPQGFIATFFDGSLRPLKVDDKTLEAAHHAERRRGDRLVEDKRRAVRGDESSNFRSKISNMKSLGIGSNIGGSSLRWPHPTNPKGGSHACKSSSFGPVAALFIALPLGVAGIPAAPAIDVSLVTPKDFLHIVIHPRRIAQTPLVAEALKEETIAAAVKKSGIDPSEVQEIVCCLVLGRAGGEAPNPIQL